jgi:hypothetical protein
VIDCRSKHINTKPFSGFLHPLEVHRSNTQFSASFDLLSRDRP